MEAYNPEMVSIAKFDTIIELITEQGQSLIGAIRETCMSTKTFYMMLEDEERAKRYARATEIRADMMAEAMLEIADESSNDTILTDKGEKQNSEWINRSRLRVDTRKWLLAKMQPKKYGEKVDVTSNNEKISGFPTLEQFYGKVEKSYE